MNRLFIVGAGGLGREVENNLLRDPITNYKLFGYLDDNLYALDGYPSYFTVVDKIDSFVFADTDVVIIAIGDSKVRKRLYNDLKEKVKIITYINSNNIIGNFFKCGDGCLICLNNIISPNVKFGDNVFININTVIGHDVVIKDNVSIMCSVDIGGNVVIGENVYIGTKATIMPGVQIGDNITIGAGSVVVQNLTKSGAYFGNPAKLIYGL